MNTKALLYKLYSENNLDFNETLELLNDLDNNLDLRNELFKYSLETKEKYYQKDVYMRGLIEFSNYCKQNCLYCGIQRNNKNVKRYRLSKEDILACCKEGYSLGFRTFVLQGGEDSHYTDEILVDIIKNIKNNFKDCALTLSIGEKSYDSYLKYFNAGASRFLLRHETADINLYNYFHPEMDLENRKKCLFNLKKIGYQVGAGFMVGLKGQTNLHLAKDLIFLKELSPHMVGIGPYLSHKDTILKDCKNGELNKTLIMLALTRLFLPKVLLPSTTALGTLDKTGREKALKIGCNVVMPNLSPTSLRENYSLYDNKICTGDEAAHCRKCIQKRIEDSGFKINMDKGDHIDFK